MLVCLFALLLLWSVLSSALCVFFVSFVGCCSTVALRCLLCVVGGVLYSVCCLWFVVRCIRLLAC